MIVFLESEVYGYEEFKADDLDDAIRIVKELWESSLKEFKRDQVPRKIGIVIGDYYE